jgi:hypothetical protein
MKFLLQKVKRNAFLVILTAAWKGFHNLQVIRPDSSLENIKMISVTQKEQFQISEFEGTGLTKIFVKLINFLVREGDCF